MDIDKIWQQFLDQAKKLWSEDSLETWIFPIVPSLHGSQLLLTCRNKFDIDWLESRYLKDIMIIIQGIAPDITEFLIRTGVVKMDNEKFQELVLAQFDKINQRFDKMDQRFDNLESQVKENTQILKTLEHSAQVNKAEHDIMITHIVKSQGIISGITKRKFCLVEAPEN